MSFAESFGKHFKVLLREQHCACNEYWVHAVLMSMDSMLGRLHTLCVLNHVRRDATFDSSRAWSPRTSACICGWR